MNFMRIKHLILIWALAAFLVFPSPATDAKTVPLDSIVAVVDEDVILKSELDSRLHQIKQSTEPSQLPPEEQLIDQVLERLIVENLELQMANRAGIRISDQELNEAMAGIAAQNNMNLDQFRDALAGDGILYSEMRSQVKREMQISRVQRGVMGNRIQISEQELNNFLQSELGEMITSDEYHLLHILLAVEDTADATLINQVRRKSEKLLEELRAGGDFKRVAIANSAGQNALKGGDLGWRKPAQLPTLFADKVQKMAVGEVAGPIKSGSGFHLVKLVEKRGAQAEGQVAQTRSRHILIQPSEIRSDKESRELAQELLNEIRAGGEFDRLAALHSDDPGSALSGGDLGWNQAGTFVPRFEEVSSNLEIDEISDVFKTTHGYHILQVTGRRIEDFTDEYRRNLAANYLRSRKFEEELEIWTREIREEAFVEIRI
jgi:peptidyl-prolyl cis-trans isomerase SurA